MLSTAPRLAAHPIVQVERRVAAPFAAIARVDSRAAALVTAVVLALIGVSATLLAVVHLGELAGLSSLGRGLLIAVAIAWILTLDAVEPLGFRARDVVGSLVGEVDTYRPIAAAWLSLSRAGLGAVAVTATVVLAATSMSAAGVTGLLAVAAVASQAESVARRRAWSLSDAAGEHPDSGRSLGRDEDLVDALTGGPQR